MSGSAERETRERQFLAKYFVLVIVVGIAGAVVVRVVMHKRRTSGLLKAARAAGYPTSFAELAEYTRLPEGVPNAADVYARAFAAFVPPADDANLPILGDAEMPGKGEPMAKTVAEFLSANQDCLTLLREAAQIEHCRYDWDYADWDRSFLWSEDIKSHARLLRLAIAFHALEDDADAAVEHIKVGLRFGESLRREPGAVCYLLRLACYGMALGGLEGALNATTLGDDQLVQLRDAVDAVAEGLDFSHVMITQQCFSLELCRIPQSIKEPRRLGPLVNLWIDQGLADVLAYGRDYIEVSRLPTHERLGRAIAIDRDLENLPSFLHALTPPVAPVMTRVTELDLRLRAHLTVARTALAIERHRLATNELPEELGALVTQYLDAVPIDPFDGKPLRYRQMDSGYLLYSVREDSHDNGGLTRDEVNKGDPYDLCFIVAR